MAVHVVIMGMMGVGKSVTAQALADRLGWEHHDADVQLESLTGTTGGAYAASFGVDALHELEVAVVIAALSHRSPAVISASAYTIESAAVRSILQNRAVSVWLTLPIDETLRRQATGDHRREMDRHELVELTERRNPLFAEAADVVVPAELPTEQIVEQILDSPALAEVAG